MDSMIITHKQPLIFLANLNKINKVVEVSSFLL